MKKIYQINPLILILVIGITLLYFFKTDFRDIPSEKVINLSELESGTNRTNLLTEMVQTQRKKYDQENTFILNNKTSSIQVVIGAYRGERMGETYKPGGIVLLKRLPNNKDELFLEITSDNFEGRDFPDYQVKDINNDGRTEIVVTWIGGMGTPEASTEFWVVSINSHDRSYTILNNTIGMYGYFNSKDLDGDLVDEIIITVPETAYQMGQGPWPEKIYKWNGTEYYLLKKTTEPVD